MSLAPRFIEKMDVGLCFRSQTQPVGVLVRRDRAIYFEYHKGFLSQGLDVSPIKCPLRSGVMRFDQPFLAGLPGFVFDCLPDGWGRLLIWRYVRSLGLLPEQMSSLDELGYGGQNGIGALVFEPHQEKGVDDQKVDIGLLARQTERVLAGEASEVLSELIAWNGSAGGARPKAMIAVHKNKKDLMHSYAKPQKDYEPWLIKFPTEADGQDAGAMEYVYAQMARDAGLVVPENFLFEADGRSYFALKRFDRTWENRLHMHSASGLLHSDFRLPSLDYKDLVILTSVLTKDVREVEKMYRLAVFNVLAHNRDDHGKNVSFLMDESGLWKISPAYDLTFSAGPGGEHSTTVMGAGRPTKTHLRKLGEHAGISHSLSEQIIDQTRSALSRWPHLAHTYGVSSSRIKRISSVIG